LEVKLAGPKKCWRASQFSGLEWLLGIRRIATRFLWMAEDLNQSSDKN
jgi:hypothetical protein